MGFPNCLDPIASQQTHQLAFPLQVGSLLLLGMGLFCGSCYAYALTGNPSVKYGAPFGGTVLILAWLCILL